MGINRNAGGRCRTECAHESSVRINTLDGEPQAKRKSVTAAQWKAA